MSGKVAGVQGAEALIQPPITQGLRSISNEISDLSSQMESGEPPLPSRGLRSRIGSSVKRRLYRFLWWQSYQIRALAALTLRHAHEEMKVVDALSQQIERLSRENREARQLVLEYRRQVQEGENRLRQIESAQMRLQAAQIERSGRNGEDLSQLKNGLNTAESSIAEFGRRIDVESAEKEQLAARVSELQRSVPEALTALTQKIDADLRQKIEGESMQTQRLAARLSELGLFTYQNRASLSIQDHRLGLFIEEARKRLPAALATDQIQGMATDHGQHRYDSVYAAFEDALRGTRAEIKARHTVYLPLLKEHDIGSDSMPLLDLGCGRGEWLELLGEHGLQARGVDRNDTMIERCKSLGLQVVQEDALPYLATLPDASLGAVTSFHMVEHMPLDVVLALVDESLRVLKPGGILILETPNPQNILVGAYTFYFDPTHLKPLPSPMLRFFVEARGFCDIRVLEMQPYPETIRFPDDENGIARRLNEYFYGPQDYAVIGRRP